MSIGRAGGKGGPVRILGTGGATRPLLAVVGGLFLLAGLACAPAAVEEEEVAPATPEEAAPTAPAPTPARPAAPAPAWAAYVDELEPAVRRWAGDWSSQNVEGYLSHYSPSFRPPGGMGRTEWELQRKTRITRPQRIAVVLSGFRRTGASTQWMAGRKVEVLKVEFHQSYESNTYSDEVIKILELEHLDDGWKIVSETVK